MSSNSSVSLCIFFLLLFGWGMGVGQCTKPVHIGGEQLRLSKPQKQCLHYVKHSTGRHLARMFKMASIFGSHFPISQLLGILYFWFWCLKICSPGQGTNGTSYSAFLLPLLFFVLVLQGARSSQMSAKLDSPNALYLMLSQPTQLRILLQ